MGSQGTDVVLSEAATKCFPYSIECKNKETNKTLLKDFNQAEANTTQDTKPMLILSANNSPVLCILHFDDLLSLYHVDNKI